MSPVLVKHIMSEQVVSFFAEQTLPLAEDVMRIHKFRHLPVIDSDGRLVGMCSRSDVLRAQISALSGLTDEQRRARQDEVPIRQLMTRDLWTVTPQTMASHAGQMLIDHEFGCLPVVDGDGVLVGIVTERDFLRFAIKTLEIHD
jgi:CBS domain-containing membrane protein